MSLIVLFQLCITVILAFVVWKRINTLEITIKTQNSLISNLQTKETLARSKCELMEYAMEFPL